MPVFLIQIYVIRKHFFVSSHKLRLILKLLGQTKRCTKIITRLLYHDFFSFMLHKMCLYKKSYICKIWINIYCYKYTEINNI